jgi:hypothetical protein
MNIGYLFIHSFIHSFIKLSKTLSPEMPCVSAHQQDFVTSYLPSTCSGRLQCPPSQPECFPYTLRPTVPRHVQCHTADHQLRKPRGLHPCQGRALALPAPSFTPTGHLLSDITPSTFRRGCRTYTSLFWTSSSDICCTWSLLPSPTTKQESESFFDEGRKGFCERLCKPDSLCGNSFNSQAVIANT